MLVAPRGVLRMGPRPIPPRTCLKARPHSGSPQSFLDKGQVDLLIRGKLLVGLQGEGGGVVPDGKMLTLDTSP